MQWLVAWTALSHCLNQRWIIVHWAFSKNRQWHFNQILSICIQENALENVREMASILLQPECVNKSLIDQDNKGIKNGCPCIVEIRGTQGCALVGDPARAVGECRDVAKAQP